MLLSLLTASVLALPPDGLAVVLPIGSSQVERMAVSEDGDVVAGRIRASKMTWALYLEDWSFVTSSSCGSQGPAIVQFGDEDERSYELWVACDDGVVRGLSFDGKSLGQVVDTDNSPIEFDVSTNLDGIWYDPDGGFLYPISGDGSLSQLHIIDVLFDLTVDYNPNFPMTLPGGTGFVEAVLANGELFVAHTGNDFSIVNLANSAPRLPQFGAGISCDDLAPGRTGVYCLDRAGTAAYIPTNGSNYTILSTGPLEEPLGIAASLDPEDEWLAITGQSINIWEMSGGVVTNSTPTWTNPGQDGSEIGDGVASDGYVFGGGLQGNLRIATARPWIDPETTAVTPTQVSGNATVTVTFTPDEDVDYDIRRGGDRTGTGTKVASGSATGGELTSVDVEVDGSWEEGDNFIYVIGTDSQGVTGHARTVLNVDNPPDPPNLKDGNLGFGDKKLVLSFDGIRDADLARYEIYVTTTPFERSSFPVGGPAYDGSTRLTNPIVVTAAGGASVTVDLKPLENFVEHYVALHAIDAGGKEGPMSKVIKGTPRPSNTAAELAGEEGGAPCATAPGTAGWLTFLAGGLALVRRRRALAATALVGAVALAPPTAHAQDRGPSRDTTPARGDFELRYGVIDLIDEDIEGVYDKNPHNLLHIEAGPQFLRFFEIDFGAGFYQELAQTEDLNGIESAQKTMLTWFPFALDGTVRLHIVDEQILVPFARYGFDYIIWSEKSDNDAGGKDTVNGAKWGNHFGVGVNLLLDPFAKARASLLEAQTGINDTYLTFEYREQNVDSRERPWSKSPGDDPEGFSFTGTAFMVGLKLDY